MRYAILADIHSNLEAFQAVLAHLAVQGGADQLWCLGDIVGYGPDPAACIELLQQQPHISIAGNHDWAAIGKVPLAQFNPDAAAACRWTALQLETRHVRYLESLPLHAEAEGFTLVHGSPREPTWEYLLTLDAIEANLGHQTTPHCLVGHSHVPFVAACSTQGIAQGLPTISHCEELEFDLGEPIVLNDQRFVINPGAVGQPRDGDPKASYAVYDATNGAITFFRTSYDIEAVQRKMRAAGLPSRLSQRLSYGL